eukprot:1096317-Pyramimonas_sp.AAC.1
MGRRLVRLTSEHWSALQAHSHPLRVGKLGARKQRKALWAWRDVSQFKRAGPVVSKFHVYP